MTGRTLHLEPWSTPISDADRRLARRVSPEGIWVS